jgi:hypothetical protein
MTAAACPAQPLGPEIVVNTYSSSHQHHPAVAVDGYGNAIIVWMSNGQDGDGYGVYGQRYGVGLAPIGSEFRVHTTTQTHQWYPAVSANARGIFVVSWASEHKFPPYYYEMEHIFFQRYDAPGTPLGGETVVSEAFMGTPVLSRSCIALSDAGSFEIFYIVPNLFPGQIDAVVSQGFDDEGNPIGSVWTYFACPFLCGPVVTGNGCGDYVALWKQSECGHEVEALTGSVGGVKYPVFPIDTLVYCRFDAAIGSNGDVVFVWIEDYKDGVALWAQRYDFKGKRIGAGLLVKEPAAAAPERPAVAAMDNGDFLVVWDEEDPDTDSEIYARRYRSEISGFLPEVHVNEVTPYEQHTADVAASPDGRFIITWASDVNDGTGYNVCACEMETMDPPAGSEMPAPDIRLSQNYPNPFNPLTTIEFELSEPAYVCIDIYTVQGIPVIRLERKAREAGKHTVTWDGRDANGDQVSSGVYFYSLKSGSRTLTKKMLLVR